MCLAAVIPFISQRGNQTSLSVINHAGEKLVSLRDDMTASLERISRFTNENEYNKFFSRSDKDPSGFSYYVFRSGNLIYWSDNEPAISDSILATIGNGAFLHLSNGDFLAYKKTVNDVMTVGLILIKHSYKYENKYLINNFNPVLGIGNDFTISSVGDTLFLPGNIPAYALKHDSSVHYTPPDFIALLYFIVVVLLLLSFYLLLRHFSSSPLRTILFISLVMVLRVLMIYLKVPGILYDHGIFSPAFYASSFFFNSLGDMLLNASLFLIIAISLYENKTPLIRNKFLSIAVWTAAAIAIHLLIRGLVINSRISFELNSPSDINLYSILAFTSISVLLISLLFLAAYFLKAHSAFIINGKHAWFGITVCAIYTAFTLTTINREKEQEARKLFAHKAEMSRDHVAEYLIGELEEKISSDKNILEIVKAEKNINEELASYIGQKYFSGY